MKGDNSSWDCVLTFLHCCQMTKSIQLITSSCRMADDTGWQKLADVNKQEFCPILELCLSTDLLSNKCSWSVPLMPGLSRYFLNCKSGKHSLFLYCTYSCHLISHIYGLSILIFLKGVHNVNHNWSFVGLH